MTTTPPQGGFDIDPRLGAAAIGAPAASREDSCPQAIIKFHFPTSLDYKARHGLPELSSLFSFDFIHQSRIAKISLISELNSFFNNSSLHVVFEWHLKAGIKRPFKAINTRLWLSNVVDSGSSEAYVGYDYGVLSLSNEIKPQ